jgi:hypothetical protein
MRELRSWINVKREGRSLWDAAKDRREYPAVDRGERAVPIHRLGQLKVRSVRALSSRPAGCPAGPSQIRTEFPHPALRVTASLLVAGMLA